MLFNQPLSIDWTAAPAGGTLSAKLRNLATGADVGPPMTAVFDSEVGGNYHYFVNPQLDTDWSAGMQIVWYDDTGEARENLDPYLAAKRTEILMRFLRLVARSGYSDAAALAELNATGTGAFSAATDALQAIRDRGDEAWTTGAGGGAGGATPEEIWAHPSRTLTGAATTVTVSAPVDVGDEDRLTLIQGDDYSSADRLPTWSIADYAGPSLEGATGTLRLLKFADYEKKGGNAAAALEVAADVTQVNQDVTVTAPITSAQTASLDSTPPLDETTHQYHLVATTTSGEVVTLKLSPATVRRRINAGA